MAKVKSFSATVAILLCFVLSLSDCQSTINVTLGCLLNADEGLNLTGPAIPLAIAKARADGYVTDVEIKTECKNVGCEQVPTAREAERMKDNVSAFLGPDCFENTKTLARLTSNWNVPQFAIDAGDPELDDKETFKTLVRLSPSYTLYSSALVRVFQNYNWSKASLLAELHPETTACGNLHGAVGRGFKAAGIGVSNLYFDDYSSDDDVLEAIQGNSRVVLLCTEKEALVKRLLTRARDLGMTNGDLVSILTYIPTLGGVVYPWIPDEGTDEKTVDALTSLLQFTPVMNISEDFKQLKQGSTWQHAGKTYNTRELDHQSAILHDATYLYLQLLNKSLTEGHSHTDGRWFLEQARGRRFAGASGDVLIDDNGDRQVDFQLLGLLDGEKSYSPLARVATTSNKDVSIREIKRIEWLTQVPGSNEPTTTPECGLGPDGDHCDKDDKFTPAEIIGIMAAVVILAALLIVSIILCWMFIKYSKEVQTSWKASTDELHVTEDVALRIGRSEGEKTAEYQGKPVRYLALSPIASKERPSMTRQDKILLKEVRDLKHENVSHFYGLCPRDEGRRFLALYQHGDRGTLQSILKNDGIKLDWTIKNSMIYDMINGLEYLQSSEVEVHGRLRSTTCVIDKYWGLRLTEFGLSPFLRQGWTVEDEREGTEALVWTAPELLRNHDARPTPYSDVYAAGIIVYETVFRRLPYATADASTEACVGRVRNAEDPPYRPPMTGEERGETKSGLLRLMESCWQEVPQQRGMAAALKDRMKKISFETQTDHSPSKLRLLERHSVMLENQLDEKRHEIETLKRQTVVNNNTSSDDVKIEIPEDLADIQDFNKVTIFLGEIHDFYLSALRMEATDVMKIIHGIETQLSDAIKDTQLIKIETPQTEKKTYVGAVSLGGDVSEVADVVLALRSALSDAHQLPLRGAIVTAKCSGGMLAGQKMFMFGKAMTDAHHLLDSVTKPELRVCEVSSTVLRKDPMGGFVLNLTSYDRDTAYVLQERVDVDHV